MDIFLGINGLCRFKLRTASVSWKNIWREQFFPELNCKSTGTNEEEAVRGVRMLKQAHLNGGKV